jgi:hypothetical protein
LGPLQPLEARLLHNNDLAPAPLHTPKVTTKLKPDTITATVT